MVSAAEMAMMLRFTEDPNMFTVPFVFEDRLVAAPAQFYSWTVPSAENCRFWLEKARDGGEVAP